MSAVLFAFLCLAFPVVLFGTMLLLARVFDWLLEASVSSGLTKKSDWPGHEWRTK